MIEKPTTNYIVQFIFLLLLSMLPWRGNCQSSGETTVNALVEMGFENVRWTEDNEECVYVIENAAYRLSGIGIGKAIDQIQQTGISENKSCRLIVVENNVPLISLNYKHLPTDTTTTVARQNWDVSYDLGNSWNKVKKEKKKNNSLFKIDVVVYPDFSFQNLLITQVYQVLLNINPAVEISLWNGMKLTAQIIFPIVNDYGKDYSQIRQGYITASQTFRLPYNTFITGTIGTFNNRRWGVDIQAKHYLMKDERFSFEGRVGYTGVSKFEDFVWHASPLKRLTWTVGGNFYWPKFNTQLSMKVEQYLLGEKGVRFDLMRTFRHAAIGIYAMKAEHSKKNGGFYFQVALPPYGKYKRNKIRVTPSKYFGISYNGGNERFYGKSYIPRLSSIYVYDTSYNPYFIKSELLNF